MSSEGMKYLVRTPEGAEYGPADRDTLIVWAKTGRISLGCEVRNTVMQKWAPAEKVEFLEGLVTSPEEELRKQKQKPALPGPVQQDVTFSLNRPGFFKYKPAPSGKRLGAWLMDVGILALVWLILIYIPYVVGINLPLLRTPLYLATSLLTGFIALIYYTIGMGFAAQTVGQWFFGVMVVRPDGGQVLLGRAFCFTILHFFLFWSAVFATLLLPSKRAIHDKLCGVVVICITNREYL